MAAPWNHLHKWRFPQWHTTTTSGCNRLRNDWHCSGRGAERAVGWRGYPMGAGGCRQMQFIVIYHLSSCQTIATLALIVLPRAREQMANLLQLQLQPLTSPSPPCATQQMAPSCLIPNGRFDNAAPCLCLCLCLSWCLRAKVAQWRRRQCGCWWAESYLDVYRGQGKGGEFTLKRGIDRWEKALSNGKSQIEKATKTKMAKWIEKELGSGSGKGNREADIEEERNVDRQRYHTKEENRIERES